MATRSQNLTATDIVLKRLRGRRLDPRGLLFEGALLISLLLALLFLVVLLYDVFSGGVSVIAERGVDFLSGNLSSFPDRAGVGQAIRGSLGLLFFVVVIAFPLGVAAAVYLEEYAKDTRFNRFINVNIRNLAGVPSVVFGLLGLAIFVELLGPVTGGRTLMAAGITLALLVLPIVIITSAEALRAVPQSIREAGYGVGATQWEVVRSHVLPSAAPGILTGTILSLSRAIGEAAPILLVGAITGFLSSGGDGFFQSFQERFTALPIVIFAWSKEADLDFRSLTSAAIIVLMATILLANAIAIFLRNRYERKW